MFALRSIDDDLFGFQLECNWKSIVSAELLLHFGGGGAWGGAVNQTKFKSVSMPMPDARLL